MCFFCSSATLLQSGDALQAVVLKVVYWGSPAVMVNVCKVPYSRKAIGLCILVLFTACPNEGPGDVDFDAKRITCGRALLFLFL